MATTYKNAQVQGTSGLATYATLYNTDGSTTAVVSSIVVTNTTTAPVQYQIAIMGSAGTPSTANFIVYNDTLAPNDVIALTLGVTLSNTQYIRVSSTTTSVAFNAFVSEIS